MRGTHLYTAASSSSKSSFDIETSRSYSHFSWEVPNQSRLSFKAPELRDGGAGRREGNELRSGEEKDTEADWESQDRLHSWTCPTGLESHAKGERVKHPPPHRMGEGGGISTHRTRPSTRVAAS